MVVWIPFSTLLDANNLFGSLLATCFASRSQSLVTLRDFHHAKVVVVLSIFTMLGMLQLTTQSQDRDCCFNYLLRPAM